MKKIKEWKSFESSQIKEEFDYDYVRQCFIDLIESGKIKYIDDDFVVIEYIKFAVPDVLGLGSQPEYRCDIFFDNGMEYGELMHTPTIKVNIWHTHH